MAATGVVLVRHQSDDHVSEAHPTNWGAECTNACQKSTVKNLFAEIVRSVFFTKPSAFDSTT